MFKTKLVRCFFLCVVFCIFVMPHCKCKTTSNNDIKNVVTEPRKDTDEDTDTFSSRLKKMDIPDKFKLKEICLGAKNAPLELIIYSSYTCPHCREFHNKELQQFIKKYVNTKKIRIVFRNYLDDQGALEAAQIIRCLCNDNVNEYIRLSEKIFKYQVDWLKSVDPQDFLRRMLVGEKINDQKQSISKELIEQCLKRTDIGAGLMIEQKRAMHQYGLASMPAFIFGEQIWIGAITLKELEEFCGLISNAETRSSGIETQSHGANKYSSEIKNSIPRSLSQKDHKKE